MARGPWEAFSCEPSRNRDLNISQIWSFSSSSSLYQVAIMFCLGYCSSFLIASLTCSLDPSNLFCSLLVRYVNGCHAPCPHNTYTQAHSEYFNNLYAQVKDRLSQHANRALYDQATIYPWSLTSISHTPWSFCSSHTGLLFLVQNNLPYFCGANQAVIFFFMLWSRLPYKYRMSRCKDFSSSLMNELIRW